MLMAEMKVLETPAGKILREILRAGGRPGFSSRGRGKSIQVKKPGVGEVQQIEPGFKFDSFDFVCDPSFTSAKIKTIKEAVESERGIGFTEEDLNALTRKLQRHAGVKPKEKEELTENEKLKRRIRNMAGF